MTEDEIDMRGKLHCWVAEDINASNVGVDMYNLAALDLIERGVGPTVAVDDV